MGSNGTIILLIIIVAIIFVMAMYSGKCSEKNDYYTNEGDYKLEDNAYSKTNLPSYQENYYLGSGGYGCPPCVQQINPCASPLPAVYSPGAASNYYGSGCTDPFDKYEGDLKSY